MNAYATVDDLGKRWRTVSASEKERVETLLSDASALIAAEAARVGLSFDKPDPVTAANLTAITCEVVKRAMLAPIDQAPYTQQGVNVGEFGMSLTYANPTGDLYLTSSEKRRLGIDRKRCTVITLGGDS